MQVAINGFNPVHVARLLAVSRAYFYADFSSLANEKNRENFQVQGKTMRRGRTHASREKIFRGVCMVIQ